MNIYLLDFHKREGDQFTFMVSLAAVFPLLRSMASLEYSSRHIVAVVLPGKKKRFPFVCFSFFSFLKETC